MTYINIPGVALPPKSYSSQHILDVLKNWLAQNPRGQYLAERFISSGTVNQRYFALEPERILEIGDLQQRAELFESLSGNLSSSAIEQILSHDRLNTVNGLVTVSCSCPTIPALDTLLINQLPFRHDITRVPVYQYGCIGGVSGLSLAARLAESLDDVMLVSCELCSLVFQPENNSPSQILGASLFGDGAAAVLVSSKTATPYKLIDSSSCLIPDSRDIMGYDVKGDGFHLRLDKSLPECVVDSATLHVQEFLAQNSLKVADIDWWLLHPGGAKVLKMFESAFEIEREKLAPSLETLRDYGNMSSATVLFVLKNCIEKFKASKKSAATALMLGIGPGLCTELLLIQMTADC